MNTKEVNYQFRQRYSVIHCPDRRDADKVCGVGQVEVDNTWTIVIPADADAVVKNAARDLEDYLFTSMNVSVRVAREGSNAVGDKRIVYGVSAELDENSYRFAVSETEILLVGGSPRMAAQASYYLEDLMNLCEAPFLDQTDEVRRSLFGTRMVHSGFGIDMYPNEHLVNLAHAGITAVLLFVKAIDQTAHGYQDFNDLCYRAAQYGIDVYAYSYFRNKFHPDDEGAEEYYESVYGHLFDRCPYFKGLIFVGEDADFPSKDPHTCGVTYFDDLDENGNPRHNLYEYPGYFPCVDYADLMNLIKKIVYKRRPDADIVLWSYNWGHAAPEHRKALLDVLPKDVAIQATYEMFETVTRDGVDNRTVDYTLFIPGPGKYFTTEGEFAKQNGLRFYSMTNTGGLTWDIGVVPYLPAPYQWMKRYEGMRKAHDEYGLVGLMESHHYGCTPSFITELAKWAFYSPAVDLEDTLRRLVVRDFGADNADTVCKAYRHFSEGIHHLVSTDPDQYGPHRVGPAYPFQLFENAGERMPQEPYAHFGSRICFTHYGMGMWGNDLGIGLNVDEPSEKDVRKFDFEIESFTQAEAHYARGCELLASVIKTLPERKRDNAERILALAMFIRNTMRTSVAVKEFYKRKCRLLKSHGEERNRLVDEMLQLCRGEVSNAEDTIPLVEFDSRLGFEPSMEYMCDRAHIEWKLERLYRVIDEELPSYYEYVQKDNSL